MIIQMLVKANIESKPKIIFLPASQLFKPSSCAADMLRVIELFCDEFYFGSRISKTVL